MGVAILLILLAYVITGLARNILYIYKFCKDLDKEDEIDTKSKQKLVE